MTHEKYQKLIIMQIKDDLKNYIALYIYIYKHFFNISITFIGAKLSFSSNNE